jgi:hypothetical protein
MRETIAAHSGADHLKHGMPDLEPFARWWLFARRCCWWWFDRSLHRLNLKNPIPFPRLGVRFTMLHLGIIPCLSESLTIGNPLSRSF